MMCKRIFKSALFLLISAALLSGCDSADYKKAASLAESGNYDEAIAIYKELGDYKDSVEQIPAVKYQKGEALFTDKQFDEAIIIFSELGGYKDSANRIPEIKYGKAEYLRNSSQFEEAIQVYKELGDYRDSADNIIKSYTAMAEANIEKGDYISAIDILKKGAPDNTELLDKCYLSLGEPLIKEGKYSEAYSYISQLSSSEYNDMKYYCKGMDYAVGLDYVNAVKNLAEAHDYMDSKAKTDEYLGKMQEYVTQSLSSDSYNFKEISTAVDILDRFNYKNSSELKNKLEKAYDNVAGKYVYVSSSKSSISKDAFFKVSVNKATKSISIDFYTNGDKYDFQKDYIEKMSGEFNGYGKYSGFKASKASMDIRKRVEGTSILGDKGFVEYVIINSNGEASCSYIGSIATFRKE